MKLTKEQKTIIASVEKQICSAARSQCCSALPQYRFEQLVEIYNGLLDKKEKPNPNCSYCVISFLTMFYKNIYVPFYDNNK